MSQWNQSQWNGSGAAPGVSVSASSLIYGALRLIGVLRQGQQTNSEGLDDGLIALNEMVDSWNTERLNVYAIARDEYDLTAGKTEYIMGDGQSERPLRIESAGLIVDGGRERALPVLTLEEWRAGKTGVYNDNAFPMATLRLSWTPASDTDKLVLYTWQALSGFPDLDTQYSFPPGYALALRWNLAVQIAPQFVMAMKTKDVMMGSIEAKAVEYKAAIKSFNTPVYYLGCDDALVRRRGFDITTGGC